MPESAPTLTEWLADPLSSWGALPPAGDHISIIGLGLTLGGIGWSVWMAWRARGAARRAEQAARDASEALLRYQDSVRIETAFQKVTGIIDAYKPKADDQSVPAKLVGLIEDLDRIRFGPHFKDSESSEAIQKYARSLKTIHREISQGIASKSEIENDAEPLEENEKRFSRHHRILMNLHSYLRELESGTHLGEHHGTR